MRKIFLVISLAICCSALGQYQVTIQQTGIIRTLRMRYWNVELATAHTNDPIRPYLVMGSEGEIGANGDLYNHTLEISFDEMSHETRFYTYTLLHLNANGQPSDISSYEYVDGFTTQDITDYEHSVNTSTLYTHYRFTFPNDDMRIKVAGNYMLQIYEDNDRDKPVGRVYFSVVQPSVTVQGKIRTNTDIEFSGRYQQLDLFVKVPQQTLAKDYFICVRQNGRIDNQVYQPKPDFISGQELQFIHCKDLIFEGGNEYRHFDTYSTYYAGTHIDRITYDHSDYHAAIEPDEISNRAYMHEYDVNGQYLINAERTLENIDTEAEYMWVHWRLMAEQPWLDGLVYVGGDLFQNALSSVNRMSYDNERRCYYLDALVKQGGHDYQYWFVPKGTKKATLQRTEGSHWETGNEYTIYVYYRPFGSRYDQLVGLYQL